MSMDNKLRENFNNTINAFIDKAMVHIDQTQATVRLEFRDERSRLNSISSPAIISITPNLLTAEWYRNGRRHRVGGPAIFVFNRQTEVYIKEAWLINGKLHRQDGSAVILRNEYSGNVWGEFLYYKGKRKSIRGIHRNDIAKLFELK